MSQLQGCFLPSLMASFLQARLKIGGCPSCRRSPARALCLPQARVPARDNAAWPPWTAHGLIKQAKAFAIEVSGMEAAPKPEVQDRGGAAAGGRQDQRHQLAMMLGVERSIIYRWKKELDTHGPDVSIPAKGNTRSDEQT